MKLQKVLKPTALVLTMLISVGTPIHAVAFNSNFSNLYLPVDLNKSSGKTDAAAQAQAQYGGKILSVSEVKTNGNVKYKVKLLLDNGRIKIVTVKGR